MILTPPRTIVEVFESLPEGTLCQVINNSLFMSPAPNSLHQRISRSIFRQLDKIVETNGLGEVFYAPIDVYLNSSNIYQPDILFISIERLHIVEAKINGAPNLIIEVLSPGTERLDKLEKKAVYEQSGVLEYWIVSPVSKNATGFFYKMENT